MNNPMTIDNAINGAAWSRTWAEIDLDAFMRNLNRVAKRLCGRSKLMAAIKKDAYGHGLIKIAQTAQTSPYLGMFGIATLEEGLLLRQAGIKVPALIFCILEDAAAAEAIQHQLTFTITNLEDARAAAAVASKLGTTAKVHLKVDTGMGRLGRTPQELLSQLREIRAIPHLNVEAIYSHLSDPWNNPEWAREQHHKLNEILSASEYPWEMVHWGGSGSTVLSAAVTARADAPFWIRTGIALYGDHPSMPDLEPVMTLKTKVIYCRHVPMATPISYGGDFRTTKPTDIALVGAGYGNGYPRALSGKDAYVIIRGVKRPILGRICMDQFAVDISEPPAVHLGDEVLLFGRDDHNTIPVTELADKVGTISYECLCLAGRLNPRRYHQQGQVNYEQSQDKAL